MRASSRVLVLAGLIAASLALPAAAHGGITTTTATLSSGKGFMGAPTVCSNGLVAWYERPTPAAPDELWVRRTNGAVKHVITPVPVLGALRPAVALGRYVVFAAWTMAGGYQLYSYDAQTDSAPATLTSGITGKQDPTASGQTLVWVETNGMIFSLHRATMPTMADESTVVAIPGVIDEPALYGSTVVYRNQSGVLRDLLSCDIDTHATQTVAADSGTHSRWAPAVSPNWWTWNAIVSDYRVYAKNRGSGPVISPPFGQPSSGADPAISGNNLTYAPSTGADTDLRLWSLLSHRVLRVSSGNSARYSGISGRLVAYTQGSTGAWAMKSAKFRVGTDRATGLDRYAVAAETARAAYPEGWAGVGTVVVTCGEDRAAADPLAASGLCWKYDAPLLLTRSTLLSPPAKTVLQQVALAHPGVKVIVVGGSGSVSDGVLAAMRAIVGQGNVERIAGIDRFDLAARVASRMRLGPGGKPFPADPVALVVNGADARKFFDALAMSAVARSTGNPILLVRANGVPLATSAALTAMAPQGVVVAGGTGTVDAATYAAVGGTARWAGIDRYATAVEIATHAIENGYCVPSSVALTAKLPDGVSGGAMIGRSRGVLLVTTGTTLSPPAASFVGGGGTAPLSWAWSDIWECRVIGGTGSVAPAVVTALDAKLNQ